MSSVFFMASGEWSLALFMVTVANSSPPFTLISILDLCLSLNSWWIYWTKTTIPIVKWERFQSSVQRRIMNELLLKKKMWGSNSFVVKFYYFCLFGHFIPFWSNICEMYSRYCYYTKFVPFAILVSYTCICRKLFRHKYTSSEDNFSYPSKIHRAGIETEDQNEFRWWWSISPE